MQGNVTFRNADDLTMELTMLMMTRLCEAVAAQASRPTIKHDITKTPIEGQLMKLSKLSKKWYR